MSGVSSAQSRPAVLDPTGCPRGGYRRRVTSAAHKDNGPPAINETERATLPAFLGYLREAVIAKVDGLTEREAGTPGVPSGTSILGLIRHLTGAEVLWFEHMYLGRDVEFELGMDVAAGESTADLVAAYRTAAARSDEIIQACPDLDRLAARRAEGDPDRSMRWILVHMIEETARHAGHADILREQLDGAVGR